MSLTFDDEVKLMKEAVKNLNLVEWLINRGDNTFMGCASSQITQIENYKNLATRHSGASFSMCLRKARQELLDEL